MGRWWGAKRTDEVATTQSEDKVQEIVPVTLDAPNEQPTLPEPPVAIEIEAPSHPGVIVRKEPEMNTSARMPGDRHDSMSGSGAPTVIRAGLHLDGNIRTTNDILLEGSVRGEVTANAITVAAGATLSGNVSATVIVVDGTIEGVVRCLKLQVNTTGAVSGEIHHSVLVVEAGAAIEGTVFRTERASEESAASRYAAAEQAVPTRDADAAEV